MGGNKANERRIAAARLARAGRPKPKPNAVVRVLTAAAVFGGLRARYLRFTALHAPMVV